MEPGTLWFLHPCVSRPPRNPCRFITPEKPRPLLVPVTLTFSPIEKISGPMVCPSAKASGSSTATSFRVEKQAPPLFAKCPLSGFMVLFSFFEPKPSCSALYPSVSDFLICVTTQGPTFRTVTGMYFPLDANREVMPSFFPNIPLHISHIPC